MGVPSFFAWLLKKYRTNDIITLDIEDTIHTLYLDANCLFHPQCFKVLDMNPDWSSKDRLEGKMMNRILQYIDFLVDYVAPSHRVYISVDGVAPLAKINQQRKRRFRSIDDRIMYDELKKKHGVKTGRPWSNVAITPGTQFMETLTNKLRMYIKDKKKKMPKLDWIFSSYHTCGEGEHKILDDIRNRMKDNKCKDEAYCVYGLDADLIFLSMASQHPNMYLLREAMQLGSAGKKDSGFLKDAEDIHEDLNFVSISEMKTQFKNCINGMVDAKCELLNQEPFELEEGVINDFIVFCFLLGNDFLPHFPSVDIKKGGLDTLLDVYSESMAVTKMYLVESTNPFKINMDILKALVSGMAQVESKYFKIDVPRFKRRKQYYSCPSSEPYDVEKWEIDNMRYKVNDWIQLGSGHPDMWKTRYYQYYFGSVEHQPTLIEDLCRTYLEGVMWVGKYYFEGCTSWTWQYPYVHAPFVSDLDNYLQKSTTDLNSIEFSKTDPFTPCVQLLAVLPPACVDFLPKPYRHLIVKSNSPLADYYPTKVSLDEINKDMYWKCVPYIPAVDPKRIWNAVEGIKLSHEDKKLNELRDPYHA